MAWLYETWYCSRHEIQSLQADHDLNMSIIHRKTVYFILLTAMGEASHVYTISLFTFYMKVSIHTASLEIVHAHRVRPVTGLIWLPESSTW